MNARHFRRSELKPEIVKVRQALSGIPADDLLFIVAEALVDLNRDGVEFQSIGCADWDLTMDYRPIERRK